MVKPTTDLENLLFAKGYRSIVAADEVGIGSLAGPVVACAVKTTKTFYKKNSDLLNQVRDSKLLSSKKRQELSLRIKNAKGIKISIKYSFPQTIDRLNIYSTSRNTLRRAVVSLVSHRKVAVLVDGPRKLHKIDHFQKAITKGDRLIATISIASIIAKVYRDNMMLRYAKRFPSYGFERHKGYGTKFHVAQLTKYGPCPIHRTSFAPVAKVL